MVAKSGAGGIEPAVWVHENPATAKTSVAAGVPIHQGQPPLTISVDGADMITITSANVASDCIQIEQGVRTIALTNGVVTNFPFALTVTVDRVQANQKCQVGMFFRPDSFGVISRSVAKSSGNRGIFISEGVLTDCGAFADGIVSTAGTSIGTYAP